jgi:hypothetical protein
MSQLADRRAGARHYSRNPWKSGPNADLTRRDGTTTVGIAAH